MMFLHEITGNQRRVQNVKVHIPWKCQIFVFYDFFSPLICFCINFGEPLQLNFPLLCFSCLLLVVGLEKNPSIVEQL